MTRVAVTGANGFIGRHVLAALGERSGLEVVAASRQLPEWDLPPRVRHAHLDLADCRLQVAGVGFERLGCPDIVIHLAWEGVRNCRSLHHVASELPRQYRFLESLVRSGLNRLTVAGTCLEYGLRSGELVEDLPVEPSTPYGFAKRALWQQLEFLRRDVAFSLTWGRLFYMYGEGQADGALYPLFQAAVARGDAQFPMSGGEQLRDYLPVSEVARLLVGVALDAPACGVVNICAGRPIAVRTLVEDWRRAVGSDIALELGRYPYTDYEPMAFWGANARLRAALAGSSGQAQSLCLPSRIAL